MKLNVTSKHIWYLLCKIISEIDRNYFSLGFHRYVFLLFKQTKKLDDVEECANRGNFDLSGFVAKSELNQFVAANFYEAKHEALEWFDLKTLSSSIQNKKYKFLHS